MPWELRASWLFDGQHDRPLHDATVVVERDRIAAVAHDRADAASVGDRTSVVDLTGWTLLPGLIDVHTHLYKPHDTAADLRDKGRALLETGFLSVRDLGSPDPGLFDYRRWLVDHPTAGPRVLLCGRILSAPSPGAERFGELYRVCRGAQQFREAVRTEAARDVDVIKVMVTGALNVPGEPIDPPQLTAAELEAVVAEAAAHDLPVAAHAEGIEGIRLAVAMGVDSIEHGEQAALDPSVLDRMAEDSISLTPTLALFDAVIGTTTDAGVRRRAWELRAAAYRTVEHARGAGVRLLCGPDVLTTHGPRRAGPTELRLLHEAGLSGPELVRAATSDAARVCRRPSGTVTGGAQADLIAVPGDVVSDPSLLWREPPGAVLAAGTWTSEPASGDASP